jgi:hypothetical protein
MTGLTRAAEGLAAQVGSPDFITDPCRDGSHDCRFGLCKCPGHLGLRAGKTCALAGTPHAAAGAGWPKVAYRPVGDHTYEVTVQLAPRKPKTAIGTVRRQGRLPSMQSWHSCGAWDEATPDRGRDTRAQAAGQMWREWLQRETARATPGAGQARQ